MHDEAEPGKTTMESAGELETSDTDAPPNGTYDERGSDAGLRFEARVRIALTRDTRLGRALD